MTRRDDPIDLCITCSNMDHCSYYQNKEGPILFCEEFICDHPTLSSVPLDRLDHAGMKPLDKKNQGLCINCNQRYSCDWEKNNIRVYCEEYQ